MSEELKTKIGESMQSHELFSMCLTFRHDFGLLDQNRREEICSSLDGVFRHHVRPKMAEIAALKKELANEKAAHEICHGLRLALAKDLEIARAERNRAIFEPRLEARKYIGAFRLTPLTPPPSVDEGEE